MFVFIVYIVVRVVTVSASQGVVGSHTRFTTMIPHMAPVLVGSRKQTREDLFKL